MSKFAEFVAACLLWVLSRLIPEGHHITLEIKENDDMTPTHKQEAKV